MLKLIKKIPPKVLKNIKNAVEYMTYVYIIYLFLLLVKWTGVFDGILEELSKELYEFFDIVASYGAVVSKHAINYILMILTAICIAALYSILEIQCNKNTYNKEEDKSNDKNTNR